MLALLPRQAAAYKSHGDLPRKNIKYNIIPQRINPDNIGILINYYV
jgi:hypothetical protein